MISLAYGALWLFVFSLPWEGVIVFRGVALGTRLTGMVALGVTILAVMISGRVRRWHLFHFAALFFVACAGVGLLLNAGQIPKKFYTFVQLFLVLWMVWEIAPSRRAVHRLLLAYVLGAYIAAVDTILVFHAKGGALRRFVAGDFDPNDLAMTLALAVPMAWYLSSTFQRPLFRLLCRGYLPVGLLALGLTGSRGGMITAVVALMIVPLSMTKLTPGRLIAAIATLALTGALAVTYVPQKVVERLAKTQSEVEDVDFGGRFKFWVAGLDVFRAKPLMGYGPGGFIRAIYPILGQSSLVAHNSYISVLVEEGLIGFLFYALMLLAAVRACLRLPQADRRFALVLLATLFIAMSPLTWEDRKPVWFVLAAIVGLSWTGPGVLRSSQRGAPLSVPAVGPPRGGSQWEPAPAPPPRIRLRGRR